MIVVLGPSFASTLGFAQDTSRSSNITMPCWTYRVETGIVAVSDDNSLVYVAKDDAGLDAISSAGGQRVWSSELGGEIVSGLLTSSSQIFVTTEIKTRERLLRSISAATGITNWVTKIDGVGKVFLGISGGRLVAVANDGRISALSFPDGRIAWTRELGAGINVQPVFTAEHIIAATGDNKIRMISPSDGSDETAIDAPSVPSTLANEDDNVFWGDDRGNVYGFSVGEDEYRWQLKHGGKIIGIIDTPDGLLYASADNFVYMVSSHSGRLKWKKRMENRITGIAAWSPDLILVLDATSEDVSVLDRKKGRLVGQISPPSQQLFSLIPNATGQQALLATPEAVSSYRSGGCQAK